MTLSYLTKILPPPIQPVEACGSWSNIEEALGALLPADFKEFIETYGSGTIAQFMSVLNPFSDRPGLKLLERPQRQLDALRVLQDEFGEQNPFPLYPAPRGLLPVAITDNGDVVHWRTNGEAVDWPMVVNESRSPDYQEFQCNLTEFLAGNLDGTIACDAFPRSVFSNSPIFHVA